MNAANIKMWPSKIKGPTAYYCLSLVVALLIIVAALHRPGYTIDRVYQTAPLPTITSSPSLKPEFGPQHLTIFGQNSWHASVNKEPHSTWVQYDYQTLVIADKIVLQRQQQEEARAPKNIVLLGSDDGCTYFPIAMFNEVVFESDGMWSSEILNSKPFRYCKLEIAENNGDPNLVTLRYFWIDVRICGEQVTPFTKVFSNLLLVGLTVFAYALAFALFFRPTRDKLLQFCSFHSGLSQYYASLDMWRGLAALCVATLHIVTWGTPLFDRVLLPDSFLQVAALAVQIFVVLSGYLITKLLYKITSIQQIQVYFIRRLLRIYPLYAFVLVCLVIASWPGSLVSSERNPLAFFLGNLLMLPAFSLRLERFIVPPAWSLFIEVSFYMLMPVVVFTARKKMLAVLIALYIVFSLSEANFISPANNREFSVLKFFIIGALIYLISTRWGKFITEFFANFCVTFGLIFLLIHASRDIATDFSRYLRFSQYADIQNYCLMNSYFDQFVALGTFFLILGSLYSSFLSRIANFALFKILGAISYSIFLVHPLFVLLVISSLSPIEIRQSAAHVPPLFLFAVLLPALVGLSFITFFFVERPFLLIRPKTNGATKA